MNRVNGEYEITFLDGSIKIFNTLEGAGLWYADLKGADLKGADLTDAALTGADLRNADLEGADLSEACLRFSDLTGANLRNADLYEADLTGANLTGADLTNTILENNKPKEENVKMKHYMRYVCEGDTRLKEFNSEFEALEWWVIFGMENRSDDTWLECLFKGEVVITDVVIECAECVECVERVGDNSEKEDIV